MNKQKWFVLVGGLIILIIGFLVLSTGGGGTTNPTSDVADKSNPTAGWVTSVGDGLTFKYPEALEANYVGTTIWPPQAFILGSGPLACTEAGTETGKDGKTMQKVINKHTYCVTQKSDNATGTITTQYAYAFETKGEIVALLFSLRFAPCSKYEGERRTACETARAGFNVDTMADGIAQTFKIGKIEEAPTNLVAPAGS